MFVRTTTNTSNEEVSGFVAGQTYRAKVRAYKVESGRKVYGDYSNEILFSPKAKTLDQVTGVQATPSTNTVNVKWNAVAGATSYEIAINGNSIGSVTKNSATIRGLKAGTTYTIKVRAYNGTTPGEYSAEVTFKTNSAAPSTPKTPTKPDRVTGVTVTNIKENEATISFNKVSGATGYEILINKKDSSDGRSIKITGNSKKYTNLDAGTTYEVMVVAYKTENGVTVSGDISDKVTFKTLEKINIGKIPSVSITNINEYGATFTYNKATNATGYSISIREQGKSKELVSISTRETTTSTKSLESGKTYYVKVRGYAVKDGRVVYGDYSPETKFTTVQNYKVKNVKVQVTSATTIRVSWDNVPGAYYYSVGVKTPVEALYNFKAGTRSTPTTLSQLRPGTTYSVVVRAYYKDSSGKTYISEQSTPVQVTMPYIVQSINQ